MNKLFSKLRGYFLVHPDEAAKLLDEPMFQGSKLTKTDGGILFFIVSAISVVVLFIPTTPAILFPLATVGTICVYLLIRTIGLHHANWRRKLLDESHSEGYRDGRDQYLRHASMPHYRRIAITVTSTMVGLLLVGDIALAIGRMKASPESAPVHHDSAPVASGHHIGERCTIGVGDCRATGTWIIEGDALVCSAPVHQPSVEVCDNHDNDCDGEVDDNIVRACYPFVSGLPGIGPCRRGRETCSNGVFSRCRGAVGPGIESCDGLDNDCDGDCNETLVCNLPGMIPTVIPTNPRYLCEGSWEVRVYDQPH